MDKKNLQDYILNLLRVQNYENCKFIKIYKKKRFNSKLVRRRGRVYIINKKNPKFKARQK